MGAKLIPIIFGILFFSAIFSVQDVYGPHFTSLDGLRYDFQGTNAFFDVFVNLSDGHANPKKNADFEVCVHLETATDTITVPIEIVQLDLVSCEPITVGDSDQKNFELLHFTLSTEPIVTHNQIADISGFIELTNPAGKSVGGKTEFTVEGVELGVPACIPPTCENNCNGHGVCIADDVCQCEKGWDGQADCSVPDCTSSADCNDNNECTVDVCHDNQCVSAPIPECTVCEPSGAEVCDGIDNDCDETVDEDFADLGTACSVGAGECQRIGVVVCDSSGTGSTCNVSPGEPSSENDATTCADGIDNDCDGFTDCTDSNCIDLGISCSLPFCTPNIDCDDGNPCTVDSCNETDDQCVSTPIECQSGFVCNPATGACETTCNPTTTNPDESAAGLCNGIDDNCDGSVDEGCSCVEGDTVSCGTDTGECQQGTRTCDASGQFGACVGKIGPSTEVCDGLDNDCDGAADDGVHDHINTVSTAENLGSWCTDTSSGFLCPSNTFALFSTETGNTGKYFRVTAEECSNCPADLEMKFTLIVPAGINYNLYVYDSGMRLLDSSTLSGDSNEQVIINIPEETGSTDQSVDLTVEVRYISGSSCNDWTLQSFNMR